MHYNSINLGFMYVMCCVMYGLTSAQKWTCWLAWRS